MMSRRGRSWPPRLLRIERVGARRALVVWLALLLLPVAATAGAAEISDGRIAVRLERETGRFSLFAVTEAADKSPERQPLLFAQDPRTSVLSVREDNQIHRMGDSAGFSRSEEVRPGSAAFIWQSPTLEVEQRFTTANGISGSATVDIRVLNRSEAKRRVALRYLLDTWLGETRAAGGVHFATSTGEQIRTERRIEPDAGQRYWVSGDGDTALYYVFSGEGGSEAESVIFANWKRLADARWDYHVRENRSFDLIPYAINDSAAAVYYPERLLGPGDAYHVRFLIGVGDRAPNVALPALEEPADITERRPAVTAPDEPAIVAAPDAPAVSDAPAVDGAASRPPDRSRERETVSEIQRVNALLEEINRELSSSRALTRRRVESLEERLYAEQQSRSGEQDRPVLR